MATSTEVDGKKVVKELQQHVLNNIDKNHPLWVNLEKGTFNKDQLREWIKQEYHCRNYIMRGVYYILANALQLTEPPVYDEELRIALMHTMLEEEGEVNFGVGEQISHPALLNNVGKVLGLTKEEMHRSQILPCTRQWMNVFTSHCHDSLVEGMAANGITSERHNTVVFPRVIKALKKNYGFDDDGVEFFSEHSDPEVEVKHSEEAAALLADRIRTEDDAVAARWAVDHTLYAIQSWYRGIYDHMVSGRVA